MGMGFQPLVEGALGMGNAPGERMRCWAPCEDSAVRSGSETGYSDMEIDMVWRGTESRVCVAMLTEAWERMG